MVVGIAASGTTPYVLGGLAWAKRRGCVTIGRDFQSEFAVGARGKNCHPRPKLGRGDFGSTRIEGWDSAKNGA